MDEATRTFTLRTVIQMLFFIVLVPLLPLIISGQWRWWQAWAFALVSILGFIISRALAARSHPDLLAERARFLQHEDAKSWDKVLAPLVGLGGGLVPIVAGVEARMVWPPSLGLWVSVLALCLLIAGYVFSSYALIENRFFSGMVRIQTERNQQVVSTGPYRWVRHPGYAGALLAYLATPLLLDSNWAFLPAIFFAVCTVIRTSLEDRTLQEELPGYREYAQRVRYRLLPGVW
jgi:protein-S-isoprenylcysteine O-methyltransferase Ste14